jgi:hypothetical protein
MIEASATRSPRKPCTRSSWSTTAIGLLAGPIAQLPLGWKIVEPRARRRHAVVCLGSDEALRVSGSTVSVHGGRTLPVAEV